MKLNGSHHKALGIARALFEQDGYHTRYLDEIEREMIDHVPAPIPATGPYTIEPCGWRSTYRVHDAAGELVCITLYKKGAVEVARRLNKATPCSSQ